MTIPIAPRNSALIQDEVLGELALVLNGVKPAGPNFLNCLGSVVEACVLHEGLFVLPSREFGARSARQTITIEDLLEQSDLVTFLLREDVFKPFPSSAELDGYLAGIGAEYNALRFNADLKWTLKTMLTTSSDGELWQWSLEQLLLDEAPELFEADECTDRIGDVDVPIGEKAIDLVRRGFPVGDLVGLEGWNKRVRALQKVAQLMCLNLYVVPSATVPQLGSLSAVTLKARAASDRIKAEEEALVDDRVGHAEFNSIAVPPLTSLAITQCNGDSAALPDVLVTMRYQYRGLRQYLTDFEKSWALAASRKERLKIQNGFEAAIKKLIERDTKPSDRLIYKIWDVVKSPTEILQAVGDKLVVRGREEAIVGQVKGLRPFWRAILDAPLQGQAELLSSLVPRIAEEQVWDASRRLADRVARSLTTNVWKGA
jgi:hypothetical protein